MSYSYLHTPWGEHEKIGADLKRGMSRDWLDGASGQYV